MQTFVGWMMKRRKAFFLQEKKGLGVNSFKRRGCASSRVPDIDSRARAGLVEGRHQGQSQHRGVATELRAAAIWTMGKKAGPKAFTERPIFGFLLGVLLTGPFRGRDIVDIFSLSNTRD